MRLQLPRGLVALCAFVALAIPNAGWAGLSADLVVAKGDFADPVVPGQTQIYSITVDNAGPTQAEFVNLEDTLPGGTTFLSLTPPAGWTCDTPAVGAGGTVTCSIDELTVDAEPAFFSLEVVFDGALTAGTVITNTATVGAESGDPNEQNDSASADTTVVSAPPPGADLTVGKTGSPDPVLPGAALTYTVTVTNNGPAAAANVTLEDELPAATTFQSLQAPLGWTCGTPAVGATGIVTCTTGTLEPGGYQFTIGTLVDPATQPGILIANTAVVSSPTADPDPKNQSATAFNTIATPPAPGLAATKTAAGTFEPGGNVTYTIVLTNWGDATQPDNPGDELTDILPSELVLVSASATSGAAVATVGTNTVTWNGSLPAAGSVTITIQATIAAATAAGTTVTNQATYNYDADTNGTNETPGASDDPAVGGSADPTSFVVLGLTVVGIPVLDGRGLALLALLLGIGGAALLGWRR
jgi:uncharacterized repeat protein (TIGR01451 family)